MPAAAEFAKIDATAGDNVIVAAESGKKLQVLAYTVVADGALVYTWRSDVGGGAVDISGPMDAAGAGDGNSSAFQLGLFVTEAGKALNLNLSAGNANGHVTFRRF